MGNSGSQIGLPGHPVLFDAVGDQRQVFYEFCSNDARLRRSGLWKRFWVLWRWSEAEEREIKCSFLMALSFEMAVHVRNEVFDV